MTKPSTTAGIDTGKLFLDVALNTSDLTLKAQNTPQGWREIARFLKHNKVRRAGIEASGGYEQGVVAHLRDQGVTVLLLQPMQVKPSPATSSSAPRTTASTHASSPSAPPASKPGKAPTNAWKSWLEPSPSSSVEEDIVRFQGRLEHTREPRLAQVSARISLPSNSA